MGGFLLEIISGILSLLIFAIILYVVIGLLVAFEVVSLRNPLAKQLSDFLDAICRPILAPLRRFIPPIGGLDLTPYIAVLVLGAAQHELLPWIFRPIIELLGG